jgi:hypothetical protein
LFFSNLASMIARRGQFFLRNRKRAPVRSFCTRFELQGILVAKVMSIWKSLAGSWDFKNLNPNRRPCSG